MISFKGKINQKPPNFSAIKIDGERSYNLARKNIQIRHKPRKIDIYDQRIKSLPNIKSKVLRNNHLIVEIKFDRNKRSEINNLLDDIPIRNSRNSKYINSVRQVSGVWINDNR